MACRQSAINRYISRMAPHNIAIWCEYGVVGRWQRGWRRVRRGKWKYSTINHNNQQIIIKTITKSISTVEYYILFNWFQNNLHYFLSNSCWLLYLQSKEAAPQPMKACFVEADVAWTEREYIWSSNGWESIIWGERVSSANNEGGVENAWFVCYIFYWPVHLADSKETDPSLSLLDQALDAVPTSKMYFKCAQFLRMRIQRLMDRDANNDNEEEDVSHLISSPTEDPESAIQRTLGTATGVAPSLPPVSILRIALKQTLLHDRHAYLSILTELMYHLMETPQKNNDNTTSDNSEKVAEESSFATALNGV